MKPKCHRSYRQRRWSKPVFCEKRQGHQGLHKAEGKFWRDGQ